MSEKLIIWIRNNERIFLTLLIVVFVCIRLPGTSLPLHQDEYKWPLIANPTNIGGEIPHPPLSEFIYRTAGSVVGFNVHFRFIPLFFSVLNLLLFYFVLKNRFGKKVAVVGSLLFTLSYFSILASLMVDTDGAIMPFFFLCMLYSSERASVSDEKKWWYGLVLISAILGLFIKVSFFLAVGAVLADFLWAKRHLLKKSDIIRYGAYLFAFIILFILLLVISQKLFPFFNLASSLKYWEHFAVGNRNWLQTAIQLLKAILYTSPFLLLTPLCNSTKRFHEQIPFIAYLIFGFIFYVLLFDFSLGALDRYLQFIIIPLCALSATAIVDLWPKTLAATSRMMLLLGSLVAVAIFLLQFISQYVPPLYPKTEWIHRIVSLHWNFLYPFSGGSGPLGFYISFFFIGLMWVVSVLAVFYGLAKLHVKRNVLLFLIPLGLVYNVTFAEEYMFGSINGSASRLVRDAVAFIQSDRDISKVVVYNDNGGAEVQAIGKYARRMYATPQFEDTYRDFFKTFSGHILYIDVPKIGENNFYSNYMKTCTSIYSETDHYITATVLDCVKK